MGAKQNGMLLGERLVLPPSLWADTAIEPAKTDSLKSDQKTDVVIVGAGFTGLSSAIHLAEAGFKCIVVDAAQPGWGASGRNNGQVIAGLKQDPETIEKIYSGDQGRRLVSFGSNAPSVVWNLIEKYNIDCAPNNRGWIQPAFTSSGKVAVRARYEEWRARGVDAKWLEGDELSKALGTKKYKLGWLDPRGGSIQPMSYTRGLAKTAISLGAKLYAPAAVDKVVRKGDFWIVKVGDFSIECKHVILATGAYAEKIVPKLRTSFVPVRTAQVATKPLQRHVRDEILPFGHVSSDTRQLLTSFRQSPDGRLVMGGSGATAGLSHTAIVPYLHRAGEELFGHLGRLEWEYQWSGYFAVTTDHLPHIHEPEPDLHVAVGCNGRGIAVSTSLGIELAKRVLGMAAKELPVPVTSIGAVRFHSFRSIGVRAATTYKRLQDHLT